MENSVWGVGTPFLLLKLLKGDYTKSLAYLQTLGKA